MQLNANNDVRFEGNLVSNPNFSVFDKTNRDGVKQEVAVTRFTLALDGGKDGGAKETAFVACEAWDTAADIIGEYKKGDRIAGRGILRNNKWTVKDTGEERRELVIRVSRFYEVNIKSRNDKMEESQTV